MTSLRVFVSHASEDKHVVLPLAERLRSNGVDAWVDKWEMVGGDSLVDKVFEEGVKNCDVFLIVLSTTSVQKPWVREELNAAFALQIEKSTRLIAVRLDDCEVPVVLKSRLWINMANAIDESKYRDLLNAIFQRTDKPDLGVSPFESVAEPEEGSTLDEAAVLDLFVKQALESGPHAGVPFGYVLTHTGLPPSTLRDVIEMLEHEGDLKVTWMSGETCYAWLTSFGWHKRAFIACGVDADEDVRLIVALLASDGPMNGGAILERTRLTRPRASLAIALAEALDYIKAAHVMSRHDLGIVHAQVTPAGRKLVR